MNHHTAIRENFPAQPNRSSVPPPPPSAARILVVDDDVDLRGILAEFLRTTGYEVRCAEDGEAGWAAVATASYDLLITDHEMPRLTGGDLLLRLRTARITLPVILISGKLVWPDADLLRVLQPGVALEKPFSWSELLVQVRRLLTVDAKVSAPPAIRRRSSWSVASPVRAATSADAKPFR